MFLITLIVYYLRNDTEILIIKVINKLINVFY